MQDFKEDFPIFHFNPNLVYLDSAATSQKPSVVIDAMAEYYTHVNANVHRGIYHLSEAASELYELARARTAQFISANKEEIVFTSGTTDGINGLAYSLGFSGMLPEKPRVLLSSIEHHSNMLPWQRLPNAVIDFIPLAETLELDFNAVGKDYDLVAITAGSNVTGGVVDIERVRSRFPNAILVVDAAQYIPHKAINVKAWGADFVLFSGHKLYGPTGIGVLFGKREHLEKMEPYKVGGGMVTDVSIEKSSWVESPHKFEAGTPPIAEAIGLAAAIDWISEVGVDTIEEYENLLSEQMVTALNGIPGVKLYHAGAGKGLPVFAFNLAGLHPHDVAQVLADNNIAVRAGHHCAQLLHNDGLKVNASLRASLAMYNTESDIEWLVENLIKAKKILGTM